MSAPATETVDLEGRLLDDGHLEMFLMQAKDFTRLHVTKIGVPSMAATSRRESSRAKVNAHRQRLRAQGLRPIQIWVPDMRAPGFKTQAHRQSLAVAQSPQASEDQSFIDAVSDLRSAKGSNEAR